jgi:hypothetical protein
VPNGPGYPPPSGAGFTIDGGRITGSAARDIERHAPSRASVTLEFLSRYPAEHLRTVAMLPRRQV